MPCNVDYKLGTKLKRLFPNLLSYCTLEFQNDNLSGAQTLSMHLSLRANVQIPQ